MKNSIKIDVGEAAIEKSEIYHYSPLPGWEVLGVITQTHAVGALIQNKLTGIYCRANAGVIVGLPQREILEALNKN